jgi:hypothetical protein
MDEQRKKILQRMLEHPTMVWRKLETLANAVSADQEETKRLLLEIEARASANGSGKWALIARIGMPGPAEQVA